jgi:hypothetical protein
MLFEISPLFAVEAEQMLLAGFPEDAIDLCKEGLEVYPDYPSALAILAKATELAGFRSEAESIVNSAKDSYYSRTIENVSYQNKNSYVSANSNDNFSEEKTESSIIENQFDDFPVDFKDIISENQFDDFSIDSVEKQFIDNKFVDFSEVDIDELIIENKFSNFFDEKTEVITTDNIHVLNEIDEINYPEPEELSIDSAIYPKSEILLENSDYSDMNFLNFKIEKDNFNPESNLENNININYNKKSIENPFVYKDFSQPTIRIDEIRVKSKSLNINELISEHINIRLRTSIISESMFKPVNAKVVITETMAEILSKQGSTQQAIDIYSKLATIEPEKTKYFNQKIEQIRNSF